jgi:O-antigen ligase
VSPFQKTLLAIVLVETAVPLDVHLGYVEAEGVYGAISGWTVSFTMFCVALLYADWLPGIAIRKPTLAPSLARGAAPGVFYFGAVALSAVFASSFRLSLYELFTLLPMLLVFLFLLNWVRTRDDALFIVQFLLLGLTIEAAVMIGLRVVGHGFEIGPLTGRVDDMARVGGMIGSPNDAASFLTVALGVALGVLLTDWPLRVRVGAAVAFGLGTLALITTLSRGGWLATGMAVSLICALALVRGRMPVWAPAVIVATGLVVVGLFSDAIAERLSRHDRGAAYSRVPLMQIAWNVIEEHPVFGAGANNMSVAMRPYAFSGDFRGGFIYVVHNRYLLTWVETGLIGMTAFLVFLGALLARAWRCWRWNDPYLAPLALGILAGVAGEMLHMCVEIGRGRPLSQLLWVLAGLVAALVRMQEEERAC